MPIISRVDGPHAAALTLNIPERQLSVEFPEDHFPQHHRVLVVSLGQARWIVCTPTWSVEVMDFDGENITPLTRNARFPAHLKPMFVFAVAEATEERLTAMRAEAMALAEVLGVVGVLATGVGGGAVWVYADPAIEEFSTDVPLALVSDPNFSFIRGSVGLTRLADRGAEQHWTNMERVRPADKPMWLSEKREGAGRDRRLARLPASDGTTVLFRTAVAAMDSSQQPASTTFEGPSAIREVLDSVTKSGLEPTGFQTQFVTSSGVPIGSSAARESAFLLHMFWLLATVDRLDLFASAGAEHAARRLLQLQRAVRRNPRAPDYEGLQVYMAHSMEANGTVRSTQFDKFVSTVMEADAKILKQQRLAKEEAELAAGASTSSSSTTPAAKAKAKGKNGQPRGAGEEALGT